MQQVELYLAGERDYTKIRGDTGPLVYPALHVYIYRALHAMTSGGNNITLAEIYFSALYVFNLGLAMACYYQAKVQVPRSCRPATSQAHLARRPRLTSTQC